MKGWRQYQRRKHQVFGSASKFQFSALSVVSKQQFPSIPLKGALSIVARAF
jgi:hypothetical protein